jgi:hypothetical protein
MDIIKTILDIIFDILCAFIEAIFDAINALFTSSRKTEMNADFLHGGEVSQILSSANKGFCLDGKRCLSIENSTKNALITGSTGNFKSSGILIPSLLRMRGKCH